MTIHEIKTQIQYHIDKIEELRQKTKLMGYISESEVLSLRLQNAIFNVMFVDVLEKTRRIEVIKARYIYYKYMKENTNRSLKAIALNGQDHSTVIHALNEFDNLIRFDKEYQQQYKEVIEIMQLTNKEATKC